MLQNYQISDIKEVHVSTFFRYSVRGKIETLGRSCKLSFELEVCLIPTSANASGSVVGIRRKRLKGDAWCYKKICEDVLKMANL